ncbi:transmembrane 6 superfamily member 1-like [Mya arenaria]|uniref:transmembrane 6 superfamily member 1-like n=1 Tax=Mya arenaria TaxID=6604 RepID=UPI0022E1EB55|nr:transmembrane 6 superfamily member 1-like [Mya arenaria]
MSLQFLDSVPLVVLVGLGSFLAAPLIYTLDKLAVMEDQRWVFMSGVITLPLFGLLCCVWVRRSPCKKEPLFYVFSIFSFTCVVDLFIALELDGYVKGFMEFYLREGEPYLRSSYGCLINYWDGTGHFAMYLAMIALMSTGADYRQLGLYWVGSIMNSMIVFMPGNWTGNKGIKWSYLLNVPYVVYPIYAGVRFFREGFHLKKRQFRGKSPVERTVEKFFIAWFSLAILVCMFRMIACMGCKDYITTFYITDIEPYLVDPRQYGKTQALAYFYYYIPVFVAVICSLVYDGQTWIKDWSLLCAGGTMQGQLVYIWCSLKWSTPTEHLVPDTILARSIFWLVNLSLVIVPHLFAVYCHRFEIRDKLAPYLSNIQGQSQSLPKQASPIRPKKTPPVISETRRVTRLQKKLL